MRDVLFVCLLIISGVILTAVVWGLVLLRIRKHVTDMKASVAESGESFVLEPRLTTYQGWNRRFGRSSTIGVIALTDKRLLFKRPMGCDIDIALTDVLRASDRVGLLRRLVNRTARYLTIDLRDSTSITFRVRNNDRWITEIERRLLS